MKKFFLLICLSISSSLISEEDEAGEWTERIQNALQVIYTSAGISNQPLTAAPRFSKDRPAVSITANIKGLQWIGKGFSRLVENSIVRKATPPADGTCGLPRRLRGSC